MSISIKRDELYKRVWLRPISILCKEFNISDRALKKICVKLNVPTPPRGYWRRLECGMSEKIIPLPKEYKLEIASINQEKKVSPVNKTLAPTIVVPATLNNPHNLIALTKKYYSLSEKQRWRSGLHAQILDLRISNQSLLRSLRILDTIIKEIETNGGIIKVKSIRKTVAIIDKQEIPFYLKEYNRMIKHENSSKQNNITGFQSETEFVPTGLLVFKIDDYAGQLRSSWEDGKRNKLEDFSGEIVQNFKLFATYGNEQDLRRENERLEYEKRQQLIFEEEKRIKKLNMEIQNIEEITRTKRYLRIITNEKIKSDSKWVSWVESYIEQLQAKFLANTNRFD